MVLEKYKDTLMSVIQLYYPVSKEELSPVIDYSINKRYKESPVTIENSYNKETTNTTLLALTDWIMSKEPILTANGVMFSARGIHKKQMFQFPKGSEEFERYNLLQALKSRALI